MARPTAIHRRHVIISSRSIVSVQQESPSSRSPTIYRSILGRIILNGIIAPQYPDHAVRIHRTPVGLTMTKRLRKSRFAWRPRKDMSVFSMFREPVGWTLSRMTPACTVNFATVQSPKCSSKVTRTRSCVIQYSRISRSSARAMPTCAAHSTSWPVFRKTFATQRSIIWSRKRRMGISQAASGSSSV